jgi:hypothetical protein
MSVVLLLKYPNSGRETRLIPISTEEAFETYWLPTSRVLGLKWLPLFHAGVPVTKEDVPSIQRELEVLRESITSPTPPQLPAEVAARMVGRIDELLFELNAMQSEANVEAFIG